MKRRTPTRPPPRGPAADPARERMLSVVVERAKRRIIRDVQIGHVPREARDFSELHDYRDANMYVLNQAGNFDQAVERAYSIDLGDGEFDNDAMWEFYGEAQSRLDAWVKSGALRNLSLRPGALARLAREARERAERNKPYAYLAADAPKANGAGRVDATVVISASRADGSFVYGGMKHWGDPYEYADLFDPQGRPVGFGAVVVAGDLLWCDGAVYRLAHYDPDGSVATVSEILAGPVAPAPTPPRSTARSPR